MAVVDFYLMKHQQSEKCKRSDDADYAQNYALCIHCFIVIHRNTITMFEWFCTQPNTTFTLLHRRSEFTLNLKCFSQQTFSYVPFHVLSFRFIFHRLLFIWNFMCAVCNSIRSLTCSFILIQNTHMKREMRRGTETAFTIVGTFQIGNASHTL